MTIFPIGRIGIQRFPQNLYNSIHGGTLLIPKKICFVTIGECVFAARNSEEKSHNRSRLHQGESRLDSTLLTRRPNPVRSK
jgi:hypothetical protein